MTIDFVQATPPTSRTSKSVMAQVRNAIDQPSDRIVLTVLFAVLFCLHYGELLFVPTAGQRGLHAAGLIGFAAVTFVLKRLGADRVLRWWDFVAIIVAGAALIHPWHYTGDLVLTGLGLLFIARSDRRLASLGQLCIGLAWIGFWGFLALDFIEQWLLPIETELGYLAVSLFGSFSLHGNVILRESGNGLLVFEQCSAFHNTIKIAFIWLSLVKILGQDFRMWHFGILAMSLAAVILLNTIRIALMAYSSSNYLFWHMGYGLTIIQSTMLIVLLGIFYFGLRRSASQMA